MPFGIDDALLIGGALAGGIGNILGGNAEKEKHDRLLALLQQQETDVQNEYANQRLKLLQYSTAMKQHAATVANQQAASKGFDKVGSSYANVANLDASTMKSLADLENAKNQKLQSLRYQKLGMEAGYTPESDLQLGFEGGMQGALTGSKIANALTPANEKATIGGDKPAGDGMGKNRDSLGNIDTADAGNTDVGGNKPTAAGYGNKPDKVKKNRLRALLPNDNISWEQWKWQEDPLRSKFRNSFNLNSLI